jgi:hypothetical protein
MYSILYNILNLLKFYQDDILNDINIDKYY